MAAGTAPDTDDYSEEELRGAVLAARERSRDVAAHAHGALGIQRAARAGVRSIEHASMLDDAALQAVRQGGAFLVMNPLTNQHILAAGTAAGYADYQVRKSATVFARKMASLRRAVQAGLPVAFGTDSGVQPHGIGARQFQLYVQAGMTPLGALRAATVIAARLLRMERSVGQVAPGFYGRRRSSCRHEGGPGGLDRRQRGGRHFGQIGLGPP